MLAFLVPTLVLLSVGGFLLYRLSRNVLEVELGNSLVHAASVIAAQQKPERVLALTAEDAEGEGSRTWRSVTTQLKEAQVAAGLRRVLVFDAERRARVDVGGGLPPLAEVPELLRDATELQRVFEGHAAASQVLFQGKDGAWYKTGYAPLLEGQKVVAVVAVEGNAAFFGPLETLRNGFLALLALTLGVLAVAAVLSARAFSTPLERLVTSALRIGGGDLATAVPDEPTREVGALARELEAMRRGLESRDRQLKLMLGGIAHEVKNPLGGIELFSGLLDEELKGSAPNVQEATEHVARIRRELDYLKRIVDDFLAYAREQKLSKEAMPAKRLLENAQQHLSGEASGKGVKLVLEAAEGSIEGDENLLTSALVNLAKNAVQASKAEQTVTLAGRVDGNDYVLEVRDAGGGIPADKLERIFEPFFTTKEKGSGLGLALARKLFEAHGGTLSVVSAPGNTVFSARLPLKRAE